MKFKIGYILLFSFFLSSCAFNKAFLNPKSYAKDTQKTTLRIQEDTVTVLFNGQNHQPIYVRNGEDTVTFNYTIKSINFKSSSENILNGYWLIPKGVKPKITLIHFHGNSGSIAFQHFAMTLLLKYGIQVFAVDYSGFGFSTGKATRKNVLKDGNSTVDYVINNPRTKGTKVIIYGQSLGGNLAGVVAAQNNDKLDGLVIEGGFSSAKEIAKEFAGFLGKWLVREGYSSAQSIGNFHQPVLIIHSKEDSVVPFKEGKEIYKNANPPKSFYAIDGCHICGSRNYAEEITRRIFKMLDLKFDPTNVPDIPLKTTTPP